jgi:hypothetical protein
MSIIAISRGTFSGGETLAKRVAERLGYQCVSREMNLEAAAKEYGVSAEQLTLPRSSLSTEFVLPLRTRARFYWTFGSVGRPRFLDPDLARKGS